MHHITLYGDIMFSFMMVRKVYIDGQDLPITIQMSIMLEPEILLSEIIHGEVIKDGMGRLMILLYGMFHYRIVKLLSFTKIHLGIHQK